MRYSELLPSPQLRQLIRCYWFLQIGANGSDAPERIVPDGSVDLVFHLQGRGRQVIGESQIIQPVSLVAATFDGPIFIRPEPGAVMIGVRFQPGGATPLLGSSIEPFRNQIVPFDAFGEIPSRELHGLLSIDLPVAGCADVLNDHFERKLRHSRIDQRALSTVQAMVRAGGGSSVESLASMSGASARTVERWFRVLTGVGPKRLSRILRFQRLLRLLGDGRDWARRALVAGYYDQAHLIREFRTLAGTTPATFAAEENRLVDLFAGAGPMSEISNPS